MAETTLTALRKSTMKSCVYCRQHGMVFTDYPIEQLHKTKQGYYCDGHYKVWQQRRKMALSQSASTTTKAIAK
jgi:hypothetical protein